MKNKKFIITIISIISFIFIITFSLLIYKIHNENKEVKNIENLISNAEYEEALKYISNNKNEKVRLYEDILKDFLELKKEKNFKNLEKKFTEFKDTYRDNLNSGIFNKMNEEILDIEGSIEEYKSEVSSKKEEILNLIEEDIDSVKELIDSFKTNYHDEDISEIEEKYSKKLEEINIKLEENKKEEINENNNDNSSINNNSLVINSGKVGISSTSAAQNSSQIITVVSNGGSYGELVFWEKDSSGNWIEIDRVQARLGQNGMKNASEVYEMDKCTPTGIYTLTEAFGIKPNPGSGVPYRQLDGSEYWVDDENSQYYNTMQFGEPNGRWNSAEKLIDFPGYYNYSLVIDYNRWPVIPGKSSAIFLHCNMGIYTYGCVAIPEQNLVNVLNRINPAKNPVIIMDFNYERIYSNY